MIKRMIKKGLKQENRRGSALIISLVMITLLLFLAMIYAFEARASVSQSKSAADSTQARFAAKGGLNTILSLLTVELAWAEPTAYSNMNPAVSFNTGGFTEVGGRFILFTNKGSEFDDIDDYLTEPYIISGNDSVMVLPAGIDARWMKQLDKVYYRGVGNTNTTGSYQDRSLRSMGFVIIDGTGAMSPSYNNAIGGARTGADISEIVGEESMENAIITAINGLSDSHTSLSSLIRSNPTVFLDPNNRDSMLLYNLVLQANPEQYWNETTTSDSVAIDDELFERIDITALDSSLAGITTLYDSLLGFENNPSRNNEQYFCPWLKSLKVSNSTARAIAAQFAINMCDRIDNDKDDTNGTTIYTIFGDIALGSAADPYALYAYRENPNTSVFHSIDPSGTSARIEQRLFGVDNHLNLSAIMFEVAVSKTADNNIQADVTASARMVNTMSTLPQNGSVEYKLELTFESSYTTAKTWTVEVTGTITCDGTTTLSTSDGSFETVGDDSPGAETSPLADVMWDPMDATDPFTSLQLKNIKVLSLIIKDTTATDDRLVRQFPLYWDNPNTPFFAQLIGAGTANCELSESTTGNSYFFGFIAKDPNYSDVDGIANNYDGQNTSFTDQWITINSGLERNGAAPAHKTNHDKVLNITGNNLYYTNGDEGVSGAVTEDTAIGSVDEYYGNAKQPLGGGRFTRVGELGRIPSPHTQKRSLRFWAYTLNMPSGLTNVAEENKLLAGTVAEGRHDAHLLSMFKVGIDESKIGTVNLNGSYDATFRALFSGIVPNVNATVFTTEEVSDALQYVTGISTSRTGFINPANAVAENQFPFSYRGEIYRMFPRLIDDISATHAEWSDVEVDAFIEKFIELSNARQNYYLVHVTGVATANVDSGTEGLINAVHRIRAVIFRDAWKNKVKILRMDAVE